MSRYAGHSGSLAEEEATLTNDARRAVEALYRTHAGRVLRYAQRRVPRDDAEEVVAQTFLTAWRRAPHIPRDPLPWLIGVARNVIRNMERAGRRRMLLESRIAATEYRGPHSSDADPELASRIARALESLTPEDREVLMLIAWDELDAAAAATVMGWSRANFRLRLHRARKRLKHQLQEADEPFPRSTLSQATPTREEAL